MTFPCRRRCRIANAVGTVEHPYNTPRQEGRPKPVDPPLGTIVELSHRKHSMPANLTPQYLKAEGEYRRALTPDEQVQCLETMLRVIPKHKGTEKLQSDLKSKLKEARTEQAGEKKSAAAKAKSQRIPRQGAGQVALIGAPNAGKSRVLKELTKANPVVAPYPFATREMMPGMMAWEDVWVQLVDTPPITPDQVDGGVVSLARSCDLVLLCFDGGSDDAPEQTVSVLDELERRKTVLAAATGFDEEDFGLLRVRSRLVVTRAGDSESHDRLALFRELRPLAIETILVELDDPASVEALRNQIYGLLEVIRVYTKAPGRPADRKDPFTLPLGGTVEDLAGRVHKDLAAKLKFARIWGASAHDGQSVGPDHILADKDLVELHA